ncbi:peptidase domain-containing ABC transporter [Zobellia sp. B3R18]|uniref:peptidase domain-containing ABC transporter n=1 Tax=Zobellia sp. B3R18 TaxID=2841568 RepID=UPI001C079030|nr:peptidase domain-containing ABC transporter [Zobellia sp. B3R18]
MAKFPFYKQIDSKDCGPTCLKIIAKHYDKSLDIEELRRMAETTRVGSTLQGLSNAAETLGIKTLPAKINCKQLSEIPLPCILHWNKSHFVVLYNVKKNTYYISDPAHGLITYSKSEILKHWIGNNVHEHTEEGVALLLEPTPTFYKNEFNSLNKPLNFTFLSKYLIRYKRFLVQLVFGLLTGSLLQLLFPFLTQSIVDIGIRNQDIHFIYLILAAQLFLFLGKTAVEIIRSWILLHLSSRINISLISDFFIKLMNLPIAFFDTRLTGDILQRINDHERVEKLLTSSSLNVLFSLVNLFVFGLVLAYYNFWIFSIFFLGSLLYFGWVLLFLKKRKALDYKEFSHISSEQSKVIELINGMQEIKLHNAEKQFRWQWEHLQARLFKISIERLSLNQYQDVGSEFINEFKNILITVVSAKLVIDGEITLGMLLAISYIVGQLNSPISELVHFIRDAQDARISLERLSEIHSKQNEETLKEPNVNIPPKMRFMLQNVSFRYFGSEEFVLKNLNLIIPENKVTAIVGYSGSGKTTLLKLLLKFYEPQTGSIDIDSTSLKKLSHKNWRDQCGVVLQEGFIFSNTIAKNIAIGTETIDKEKLAIAVDIANIKDFIEELPLSYNTKIGSEGIGLSTGQKQRILIARAVYKNPDCLFFDEATSSLDAINEKKIMAKLQTFFRNKTVVIIAHRLSTVKNADQIVVLDKGHISEIGNHKELTNLKGQYYNLVKNQLELGN